MFTHVFKSESSLGLWWLEKTGKRTIWINKHRPRMAAPACCCMFSNNVRHLILLLTTFCITLLFSNVVLFGLTTVLHDEGDLSAGLRTADSTANFHARFRRDANKTTTEDTAFMNNDTLVDAIAAPGVDPSAHPVVSHEISEQPTPSATLTTKVQAEFFTNRMITTNTETPTIRPVRRSTSIDVKPTEQVAKVNNTSLVPDDKDLVRREDPIGKDHEDVGKTPADAVPQTAEFQFVPLTKRASIYAAPGLGILLGTIPITYLMRAFGSRTIFALSMALAALITTLMPFLISYGFVPLLLLRLFIGLTLSAALPLAGTITANWGTLKEQLTFVAFFFLFVPWAPIFSWNTTMLFYTLYAQMGVRYAYFTHAAITAFLALIFVLFYREKPQFHPWVNGIELNRIVAGKVQELKNNRINESPLSAVLRSISAWTIWTAMTGFFFVITVISTFLPTYFANMDVWMVDSMGFYGSLPFIGMPLCYILSGAGNRSICCRSTTQVRIWNTISFGTTAIFLVFLPLLFTMTEDGYCRYAMLFLTLAPLGFVVAGALRSVTLVGRFYAQHILSYLGIAFGLAMTFAPIMVLCLVRENAVAEWLRVFIATAAFLAVTSVSFAIFGRGRSAGWAEHSWDPSQTKKMLSLEPIQINREECGLVELRNYKPSANFYGE
ncbi:unnamed protein product, partial [Mesorhabditis belari]|uniref:Uncharacterized protein n=1 Tax=Mesorhabditis belari TaxID=2138241 RepID=A0AAF3EWW3_9BILA